MLRLGVIQEASQEAILSNTKFYEAATSMADGTRQLFALVAGGGC